MFFLTRRPGPLLEPSTQRRDAQALQAALATAPPREPIPLHEPSIPTPREAAAVAPGSERPKVAGPSSARDTLAEEVRLLSDATSQLRAGRGQMALSTLAEHQRRFPSGVLREERNAAKARALCLLHRFTEGRAALALLASGSPFAWRAQAACDSGSSRSDAGELPHKAERD